MGFFCRTRLLSPALVVVLCVPACTQRPPATAEPVRMRVGVPAPQTLLEATGVKNLRREMTTDSWLSTQPDGRNTARLVSAWNWNDDRTRLQLTLRNDVYFHEGTKLTPEIAAAILRENIKAESVGSFSSVTSVDVSGADRLQLTLSAPNSFLVPDLGMVVARLPGKADIGTGPFRIVESPSGADNSDLMVLRAWERYYRGRPLLDEIDIHTYPTQRSAWTALMRGEIDMLHEVSRDAADFVQAETAIKSYSFRRSYYIPFVFNMRHPALKNVEVRKAINEAVDRQVLIREGLRGRGRPADGPIWPDHWAYVAAPESLTFNPAAARLRLDAAGFPVKPATGGNMPARLSFTCLVFNDDSRFEHLALLLQRQLADVGIDMRLQGTPMVDLEARVKAGDFDAFLFEMAGRSLSWVYEFWHTREGGYVDSGYRSLDAVLEQLRASRSDEETRATVAILAKILHDDPPAVFIAWQEQVRAVSRAFDVATENNRDPLANVWQWRPVSPQEARQARR